MQNYDLKNTGDEVQELLDAIITNKQDADNRMDGIEQQHSADTASLAGQISQVNSDVEQTNLTLEETAEQLGQRITDTQSNIDDLSEEVDSKTRNLASSIESTNQTLSGEIDALEELTDSQIQELSDSVDSRMDEQNANIDERFAEQSATIAERFSGQDSTIAQHFSEQDATIDERFSEQNATIATQGQAIETRLRGEISVFAEEFLKKLREITGTDGEATITVTPPYFWGESAEIEIHATTDMIFDVLSIYVDDVLLKHVEKVHVTTVTTTITDTATIRFAGSIMGIAFDESKIIEKTAGNLTVGAGTSYQSAMRSGETMPYITDRPNVAIVEMASGDKLFCILQPGSSDVRLRLVSLGGVGVQMAKTTVDGYIVYESAQSFDANTYRFIID